MGAMIAKQGGAGSLECNETTSVSEQMVNAQDWDSVLLLCLTADTRYRFGDADDDAVQADVWLKAGDERVVGVNGDFLHAIVETGGGSGHDLEYCPVKLREIG